MTLDEAIDQLVNLGEEDPLVIAKKLQKRHGRDWLSAELLALAEDIVADRARHRLGDVRRRAEIALRPGDVITTQEMRLAKRWIPDVGWKTVAEVTAADLLALARFYDRIGAAAFVRRDWCKEVVAMMAAENVDTVGDLQTPLPPLPPPELEEAAA